MHTKDCPRGTDQCPCTWPDSWVALALLGMLRRETMPDRSLGGILRLSRELIADAEAGDES